MLIHKEPEAYVVEYVSWFHRKFRSPYADLAWRTMKADHYAITQVIMMYDVRTVLEIGTWKGYTGLLMYLISSVERVKCIDVHRGMGVEFSQSGHELMPMDQYGSMYRDGFVDLVFADTMKYPRGCEVHDFVFIDGNHDYEHVKNDTELAMSMRPRIIMWHDYNNGNDGVTKYINELVTNDSEILTFNDSCCVAALTSKVVLP